VTPPDVEQENDFAAYTSNYRFEGGTLYGSRRFSLKLREVPGTQRAVYSAFVKAVEDDAQRWILLFGNYDQDSLLEKAAAEDAANQQLIFTLGSAYLRLPDEDKAVEQFDKLLAGRPNPFLLNEVAYEYANANLRLDDALDYASSAVEDISAATMQVSLDSASPANFLLMAYLAADWDTLGWANFRSGDVASGAKYVHSAWMLSPNAIIGEHLVEIYEKLGKKHEADHICRLA